MDGFNLPMRIDNNQGCPVADCPVDLGPNCMFHRFIKICVALNFGIIGPAPLKGPFDSSGYPVGCKSACDANLDGDPSSEQLLSETT